MYECPVHRQAGQVRSSTACVHACRSCSDAIVGPSAVRAQPWLLQRLLGLDLSHAVHWCVTHCRQIAVSYDPLSHSRHNAGDRSTKLNHAINSVIYFKNLGENLKNVKTVTNTNKKNVKRFTSTVVERGKCPSGKRSRVNTRVPAVLQGRELIVL